MLSPKQSTPVAQEATSEFEEEEIVPTLSPDALGLVFEWNERPSAPAVRFAIENASDIEHVEYEITYDAVVGGNTVPQGLNGEVTSEDMSGDEIQIKYRELGTCSSGTCRYDQGVTGAKLILKVTKTDGKVYQTEKELTF